jgi:hypothetical protein
MRTLKVHLKVVALFFSVLILFQGCTVYKSASVTLDEASKSNTHVRVKTFDNQSLKFSRIEVVNNKIHGIKIHNGFTSITPIEKDNIEKIQLKDKTMSTFLSFTIAGVIAAGIWGVIVADDLHNMYSNLNNMHSN